MSLAVFCNKQQLVLPETAPRNLSRILGTGRRLAESLKEQRRTQTTEICQRRWQEHRQTGLKPKGPAPRAETEFVSGCRGQEVGCSEQMRYMIHRLSAGPSAETRGRGSTWVPRGSEKRPPPTDSVDRKHGALSVCGRCSFHRRTVDLKAAGYINSNRDAFTD